MDCVFEGGEVLAAGFAGKYLTFVLGEGAYGVPVHKVLELMRMTEITPVPQMPDCICGVINLRGRVVPVLDLRLRFGLCAKEADGLTCIVIAQVTLSTGDLVQLGMIVDAVEEVVFVEAAAFEAVPDFGSLPMACDCLLGGAQVKGRVKALLDVDKVFSPVVLEPIAA